MWPIIYRILVPGITLSVVAGLISLSSFRALKKGYKGKKTKKIKAEAVVFLMLSLFGFETAPMQFRQLCFDYCIHLKDATCLFLKKAVDSQVTMHATLTTLPSHQ